MLKIHSFFNIAIQIILLQDIHLVYTVSLSFSVFNKLS